MGTAKRERQKAGRAARLEMAKAAAARRKRRRGVVYGVILVGLIVIALVALADNGDDDLATTDSSSTSSTAPGETTSSTAASTASTVAVTIPPPGETLTGETPCPAADGSAPRTTSFAGPPPMCIDPAKSYAAEVQTSEGTFTIELDPAAAPNTVNNFVVLSRYHFYDGVAFHRIISGFMNQTGDAVGPRPGTGGPGYTIDDELPTGTPAYPDGSVAMANSGPNTNGSQWFVVVPGGGAQLSPDYSRFGTVTSGMEVVEAINQYYDPASGGTGTPTKEVVIESVTITES